MCLAPGTEGPRRKGWRAARYETSLARICACVSLRAPQRLSVRGAKTSKPRSASRRLADDAAARRGRRGRRGSVAAFARRRARLLFPSSRRGDAQRASTVVCETSIHASTSASPPLVVDLARSWRVFRCVVAASPARSASAAISPRSPRLPSTELRDFSGSDVRAPLPLAGRRFHRVFRGGQRNARALPRARGGRRRGARVTTRPPPPSPPPAPRSTPSSRTPSRTRTTTRTTTTRRSTTNEHSPPSPRVTAARKPPSKRSWNASSASNSRWTRWRRRRPPVVVAGGADAQRWRMYSPNGDGETRAGATADWQSASATRGCARPRRRQRAREELMDATMDAAAETVTSRSRARRTTPPPPPPPPPLGSGSMSRPARLRFARRASRMRRERDAACLRAASDARRAARARLQDSPSRRRRQDAAAATDQARHRGRVRRARRLKASTDRAMASRRRTRARAAIRARGGAASRRKEAAEHSPRESTAHETFRRRARRRARNARTTRQKAHAEREVGDSVAPTTRGGCIRAEARGGGGGASDARATRERARARRTFCRVHARLHARGRGRVGRHGTRRGVCQRGVQRETRAVRNGDRAGRGGVARVAGEVSRRRTARRVAPAHAEMLARGGRRAEKAETGVGVEALGASYEASWSAYAPAHGASVLEVDDANDDATSNANGCAATSAAGPRRRDRASQTARRGFGHRERASVGRRGVANGGPRSSVHARSRARRDARGRRVRVQSVARRLSRFRGWKTVPETRHHHERVVRHVDVSRDGVSGGTPRVVRRRVRPPGKPLGGDVVARHGDKRADDSKKPLHTTLSLSTTAGVVEIPVECHPSRANARATTTEVDFGAVVVGETRRRTFALENAGATPAAFELVDPGSESSARDRRAARTSMAPSRRSPSPSRARRLLGGAAVPASEGVVPGYGSVVVVATFAPKAEAREGGFIEVVVRWMRGHGDEKDGGADEGDAG